MFGANPSRKESKASLFGDLFLKRAGTLGHYCANERI